MPIYTENLKSVGAVVSEESLESNTQTQTQTQTHTHTIFQILNLKYEKKKMKYDPAHSYIVTDLKALKAAEIM